MKNYSISELMVPLSEYATVSEDATLLEAVMELERAQESFEDKHTRYRHRAILVLDDNGHVIGKISQLDVLRALEPKYDEMLDRQGTARFGFTKRFMSSMMEDYHLFDSPLEDICRKTTGQNVKKYMYQPTEGEYIADDASLADAIHLFVIGHHQSLLVTHGGKIEGILRQTDVFAAVFHMMKECSSTS